MPFVPIEQFSSNGDGFPRVSADEQANRDAVAEQIVTDEFNQDMPGENRAALEQEFQQRFGKAAPAKQQRRGFVPISAYEAPTDEAGDDTQPSTMKTVAMENPLTAAGEAAMNVGSQMIALPASGLAGLATAAGKAMGLTDRQPGDVVRAVGEKLTYQPRGEFGKAAADLATLPFQKLAEIADEAGNKVLDATGSPEAAAAVSTLVQAAPMAISPAAKGAKAGAAKIRERMNPERTNEVAPMADAAPAMEAAQGRRNGFTPIEEIENAQARAVGLARDAETLPESQSPGLEALRGQGDHGMPPMADKLRDVPGGYGAGADTATLARTTGREEGLPPRELRLDDARPTDEPARVLPAGEQGRAGIDGFNDRGTAGPADAQFRPASGTERVRPESLADPGEGGSALGMADLQRREATPARVGEANRAAPRTDLETAASGLADRSRLDYPALLKEAADLEGELFLGGTMGPTRYRIAARDGTVHKEVIEQARARYDEIRQQLGYPPIEQVARESEFNPSSPWSMIAPEDLPKPTETATRAPQPEAAPDFERLRTRTDAETLDARTVQNSFAPGANYAPLIDDAMTPVAGEARRAKPITREEVLTPFMRALGVPIYEGRIKGDKKLGHYRPKLEEVRIKRKSDLEVAAHEMAHLLDDRIPAIRDVYRTDAAIKKELRGVSYDAKNTAEGFAEFVRLWMTQPEEAASRAPLFNAWMDRFVAENKKYGPALSEARKGFTDWFGQEAIDRARSKIGDRRPINEAVDGIFDMLRQSVVDDLHGIYRMERDLHGGKLEAAGAYETARLSRASHSITDGAVRYGYPVKAADGSFTYRGKGLEEILKPAAENLEDALLYFVGRSAQELMMQGREHLFTKGEIRAMVALEKPEYRRAFAEYQIWNRGVLDFAEAQGIINSEARRLWQRTQYMPFHRVQQPGGLKGKPGDWAGIKALTGGTDNLRDILGNMVGNAAMLIDKAVKNEARQKVAALADSQKGGARFMVKIPAEDRPVKVSGDQVLEAMFKRYGIAIEGEAPAFFDFLIHGQPPAGGNVVAVLKSGKPEWYEVADPLLYRALSAIDRPLQSEVVKWLGLPKRIGQTTVTLTPDFMVANIARDTIMGSVMSRAGFRPVIDSLEGMRLRLTSDQIYKDYIANGGGLSSIYLEEGALKTKLERFYGRQGIDYRTVLDSPSKFLHAVETMADAFEMSTRLGEYKRAVARGENPRHAAYLGRDVSTDFAMRGDSKALGFLYDTVMFLRPAVISWDRLYRGIAHDPNQGAIAAKAATIAALSASLYLMNREDPRYADLADWDRDAHWHVFVGDQHFRWPKIWEIGALASAAERTVEKSLAEDPKGLGKDFARILGATFSVNLMPQIAAPLVEQWANRNNFTKAPIETPGMENVQPFLRAKPGTSMTMKAIGMATRDQPEALQLNPARAEALIRGYFNTWGLYGLMLADKAFYGDQMPEKRADELPVVRRFYSQEPARHTKYETEFYDMLAEARRLRGTLRELDQMGRPDLADEKERSPLAGEAKPLERAQKSLGAINKDMEQVRRDGNLTPAEKRQKLDALTVERNALLKEAVTDAKAAQKEKPWN